MDVASRLKLPLPHLPHSDGWEPFSPKLFHRRVFYHRNRMKPGHMSCLEVLRSHQNKWSSFLWTFYWFFEHFTLCTLTPLISPHSLVAALCLCHPSPLHTTKFKSKTENRINKQQPPQQNLGMETVGWSCESCSIPFSLYNFTCKCL